jgi:hypothetical protein
MQVNSQPRPKSVALMFLLGAFLTGGAVGYAATRTFSPPSGVVQFTPAQMRAELKQKLHLSPEQGAKFDAHYNARRAAFDSIHAIYQPAEDSIRAIYQPAIDSIRVANHGHVMQDLDSTQKAIYRQMIEDDRKRADSVRKARGQK